MTEYKIYFELYGKKMQTVIKADNKEQAKEKIKSKIIFHRIEESNSDENFMNIFNTLINKMNK